MKPKAHYSLSISILIFPLFLSLFALEVESAVYDLKTGTSHMTIYGRDIDDQCTWETVGDLNGDGLPDIILNAYIGDGPNNGSKECGEIYIFFGNGTVPCTEIDLADQNAPVEIRGDEPDDQLGAHIATGDVNGDGIDDLIVTAPQADGAGNMMPDAGEVYIIYGGRDFPTSFEGSISDIYDVRITGQNWNDRIGGNAGWYKGLALGDINGDGIKDILLFAGQVNNNNNRVCLFYGSPNLPREIDFTLVGCDLVINSGTEKSIRGNLSSGDFDGDGYDDILWSISTLPHPGYDSAFLLYGKDNLTGEIDLEGTDPDLLIENKYFDTVISFAGAFAMGDVNGDGKKDLLLSDGVGNGPGGIIDTAGEVYVLYGGKRVTGKWDLKTKSADVTILGPAEYECYGSQVGTGDLNGDGYSDIIAMSTGPDAGTPHNAGRVFVVSGSPSLPPFIDLASGGADLEVLGAYEWDWIGQRITASDLNLDGADELILGSFIANNYNDSKSGTGEAVVLYCDPCLEPGIEAGPDKSICEGMSVTLIPESICLTNCLFSDYQYRWINNLTGLPECDWGPVASCPVTPSQTTSYTAELMCSSNPGNVLRDQMTVNILPDPIPGALGNTLRAVKEGTADIRFTWIDLTMTTGGYELVILPSTSGPPTPANMDGAPVVHNEVIAPGDQFQIHVGGLRLAPALNFYKIRALSLCTGTHGPTGN